MEPLYGILYLALSALSTANWTPPPQPPGAVTNNASAAVIRMPQPPTVFFRELLAAPPAQRELRLARLTPAQRALLESSLERYAALPSHQAQHQLQSLELRWYLAFLMRESTNNRALLLQQVPAENRLLVSSRLAFWDRLSPEVQQAVLQNEMAIRIRYSLPSFQQTLSNLPPAQARKLADDIARWEALPSGQQQQVYWSFKYAFELSTPPEPGPGSVPAMAASGPPPPPAAPMGQMLDEFRKLPPGTQHDCLENFQRFQGLSQEQRARFVKAALRWNTMTETERNVWREAVRNPPAPPPPPFPPLPPGRFPSGNPTQSISFEAGQ